MENGESMYEVVESVPCQTVVAEWKDRGDG